MCRITAVLSSTPGANPGLLCAGNRSLLAQAAVPGRYQDDGWGIAGFKDAAPFVIKSPRPARLEGKKFAAAAGAVCSRVTLAHLREASNPSKLSKALLISRANTQPFCGEGFLFAHNGTLFIKDEIRSVLGKYAAKVKGVNDSEVLFWQVMKMLAVYGSPEKALEMALDEIRTVWISCRDKYPGLKAPYRGLNIFLASKDSLTVLCHYGGAKQAASGEKTALLTPGWEFGRIAWRRGKNRVVFSSEPADAAPGWKKMADPEIATAQLAGKNLSLKFTRIKL